MTVSFFCFYGMNFFIVKQALGLLRSVANQSIP